MSLAERFWWLLTILAVGWYLTVTVYVAIRGAFDIRQMLARLESQQSREE
jgi:hypothetical protein